MDSSIHSAPQASSQPKPGATNTAAKSFGAQQAELDALWLDYADQPDHLHRNRLVEAYQSLVRDIVRRFSMRLPRTVDRGDLQTAANVGLMAAISAFDDSRGVPFELYCEVRVRGALLDELRHQDWLPRPWRRRIEKHKRTGERLRSELGREANDHEMAQAMDMGLEEYTQLFGTGLLNAPAGSMGGEGGEEEGGGVLEEVPDPSAVAPVEQLNRDEILALVAERLSDQEYRVVYLRYWEGLSMREIGELTSLSESRVCKIHARLIERLQERFSV